MIRRVAGTGAVLLAVSAGTIEAPATAAATDAPPGPRLALVKLGLKPERLELLTVDETGALPLRIAGGGRRERPLPFFMAPPSWSPDGSLIAFNGWLGGEDKDGRPRSRVFVVAADGSGLRQVPGTEGARLGQVFSPNGHTIAFARTRERTKPNRHGGEDTIYESASIWLADLTGGAPRQITPWRNHLLQIPSSFSPDGRVLAITRSVGEKPPEAIGLTFDGSASIVLARNAFEPVYSPDGTRIAFLRGPRRTFRDRHGTITGTFADLYTMSAGGGGERLTHTPLAVEIAPRWDPSGQRLAYTELRPLESDAAFLGIGDSIFTINSDGSCRTKLLSDPQAVLFGATWQPGPGREAGSISC